MAGKKNTRTMRKNMDISDMDMEGLVHAVKEAAAAAPDQEKAKAFKKQMSRMFLDKLEEMEAVCEAEFERELAQLRELRRNLPSAVSSLTIGEIRGAGGYYGPDPEGNVCFKIPAQLYRKTAAEPTKTEKTVVASAKKMIEQQQQQKRMSKRTRTVNPHTPGSVVKTKVPKLMHAGPMTSEAATASTRQSVRILRSAIKSTKGSSSSNSSGCLLSSTEEGNKKGSKKGSETARETEFEDALDGFSSQPETSAVAASARKGKKSSHRNKGEKEAAAHCTTTTGAATASAVVNSTFVMAEVQEKLMDMSIANPRTPQGQNRLLPKQVRLAKDNESIITLHVSKDGTPLLVRNADPANE